MSAAPGAAATAAPLEVVVAAESLFLPPGRQSRPKRIAIVLRGLPGSGSFSPISSPIRYPLFPFNNIVNLHEPGLPLAFIPSQDQIHSK